VSEHLCKRTIESAPGDGIAARRGAIVSLSIGTSVKRSGELVIRACGSLDGGGAVRLSEAVSAAVDQHRPDVVHVDLGHVTGVDLIDAAALASTRPVPVAAAPASSCTIRLPR
jgi:hypothetical protein